MVLTEFSVVLDASALIAILDGEPSSEILLEAIKDFRIRYVGAPTLVETAMVLPGRQEGKSPQLEDFLTQMSIEVLSFDARHWIAAQTAFLRFGKGRHPARLNFGDCMTYAIAKVLDAPLLFVGQDFSQTDIRPAIAPI